VEIANSFVVFIFYADNIFLGTLDEPNSVSIGIVI
jgi:hypothetical protein